MKAFLLLLIFPFIAKSQSIQLPRDSSTNLVTYQEVVKTSGVDKDQLYMRGREWFAKTFNSAKEVIQMEDKEAGKIIGKGLSSGSYVAYGQSVPFNLLYTISVTVKDGRYRYEFSSFIIDVSGVSGRVEMFLDSTGASLNNLKLSEKFKKKAAEGQKVVAAQIISFTDSTAKRMISNLNSSMSLAIKSKDDF